MMKMKVNMIGIYVSFVKQTRNENTKYEKKKKKGMWNKSAGPQMGSTGPKIGGGTERLCDDFALGRSRSRGRAGMSHALHSHLCSFLPF